MIAYFIGGSWDLTKRHMQDCPPVFEITTIPRLPRIAPTPEDYKQVMEVKWEREFYVRVRHACEKEIAIYIFAEW